MPRIFAFSGKSGSGKDFLASVLREMLPQGRRSLFVSLADQLKVSTIVEDNIAYERVYVKKDTESRRVLQIRGTENGRNKFGPDVWVRHLRTWMKVHIDRGIQDIYLTDVRFPNEVEFVRSLANEPGFGSPSVFLFKVLAPRRTQERRSQECNGNAEMIEKIASHESETALDGFPNERFDLVLNNDPGEKSLDDLRNFVVLLGREDNARGVIFVDLDDTICHCR